jgi:hypothetical protein
MGSQANQQEIPVGDGNERHAYNTAFSELELCWHWDEQTFAELRSIASENERVKTYLRTRHEHLLRAYDVDFLAEAIVKTKARCIDAARELRAA